MSVTDLQLWTSGQKSGKACVAHFIGFEARAARAPPKAQEEKKALVQDAKEPVVYGVRWVNASSKAVEVRNLAGTAKDQDRVIKDTMAMPPPRAGLTAFPADTSFPDRMLGSYGV